MTTQGFLTYYYDEVANTAKIEMNRCTFGNTGEGYNTNNSILFTVGGIVRSIVALEIITLVRMMDNARTVVDQNSKTYQLPTYPTVVHRGNVASVTM